MKDRFQSILKIAELKENNAAKDYVDAKEAWEFNQSKLNELRAFRDEYREKNEGEAIHARQFESSRAFLSQLSLAIDSQEEEVMRMFDKLETEEVQWQESRVKRKSIEILSDKRIAASLDEQLRKDQKELDELGQRDQRRF